MVNRQSSIVNRQSSILIAPLNWGLGHATRCVPLIEHYLSQGAQVTLGGDGESLNWLRRRYPDLPFVELAPLRLRYSTSDTQTWALFCQLPHLLRWMIRDHRRIEALQQERHFDLIISDNRFGLFAPTHQSSIINHQSSIPRYYITHQLWIRLPRGWHWLEPLAHALHARIINRYNRLLVPDYAEAPGLAGCLSHVGYSMAQRTNRFTNRFTNRITIPTDYIGPLSRFSLPSTPGNQDAHPIPTTDTHPVTTTDAAGQGQGCLLLSGLEPQRSLFREQVLRSHPDIEVIEGCTDDMYIARRIREAGLIIARSGYSTIMDLHALGLLAPNSPHTHPSSHTHQASLPHRSPAVSLIPTPGQEEQQYLASLWR